MATTEDVTLRVVADIRDYMSKFQQLPGITEKQALSMAIAERKVRVRESARTAKLIEQEAKRVARETAAVEFAEAKKRTTAMREVEAAYRRATDALEAQKAAQMSASQQAVAALNKEIEALKRLEKEGADATQVAKARQAVQMAGAQKIAAARASELASATNKAATATASLAKNSGELKNAAQSVALQLPDVFSQLQSGTPIMTIFVQQGLQVVQMNMGLVTRAATALASVLSVTFVGAAVVAGGALYGLKLAVDEQRASQASLEKALIRTNKAMDPKLVRLYADAQKTMASSVEESRVALLQEAGALSSLEIAQMRAVEATRQQGRAALLAARAQYVKLESDRIQIKTALESGELTFKQVEAAQRRLKILDEEAPKALAAARAVEEQIDAQAAQVNEYYNQIDALKAQRDAELEADKARSAAPKNRTKEDKEAAKAARDEARAREELAESLRREALARQDSFAAALQAARAPFVDKSELAQLAQLKVELIDAASAATLTSGEIQQIDMAMAQLNARIEELRAGGLQVLNEVSREVGKIGKEAAEQIDDIVDAVKFAQKAFRKALFDYFIGDKLDKVRKVASVIDATFGGAVSSLFNPTEIIGQLGEAASPKKARKLAKSMAEQAASFIENMAKNIGPFIDALANNIDKVVVALVKATPKVIVSLIKAVPKLAIALVKAVGLAAVALARQIARQVRRGVRSAFGLDNNRGRGDRRRVGDTPGPMRMPRGGTVQVAPNDVVVAGRSKQAVRDQMGAAMSKSGPTEVVTILDVRDGPVRLGMSRAVARDLNRRNVGRDTTGRRRVY